MTRRDVEDYLIESSLVDPLEQNPICCLMSLAHLLKPLFDQQLAARV
jgi:hypothetical protein